MKYKLGDIIVLKQSVCNSRGTEILWKIINVHPGSAYEIERITKGGVAENHVKNYTCFESQIAHIEEEMDMEQVL